MTTARKIYQIEGAFSLYRGGKLESPKVAYETWGELNEKADNAVLIFTGLSPSAHAASSPEDPSPGWWEDMIGPEHAIDTTKYFVICMNSLGSCFGSTGANSNDPVTSELYCTNFPVLSLEDVARAGEKLLSHLGIFKLNTLIGPSMGGMTALAFQVMFPDRAESLLLISTCSSAAPMSIALRSLQREIIRSDPNWNNGFYADGKLPIKGMRLARKLGMISYRSSEEFLTRFGRERVSLGHESHDTFSLDFQIESYLEHHANEFIGQFDPNCYLYLSRASDLFDLADHGGSLEKAIERITTKKISIIGVKSDQLFPYWQQVELYELLKNKNESVELISLDCKQGHDSFLASMNDFRPLVAKFLE